MNPFQSVFTLILVAASCGVTHGSEACSDVKVHDYEEWESAVTSVELLQLNRREHLSGTDPDSTSRTKGIAAVTPWVENEKGDSLTLPTDYLTASMPLAWTHVPKCGTSFVNSLVRLPGVCLDLPVGDFLSSAFTSDVEYPGIKSVFPGLEERCHGLKMLPDRNGDPFLGIHAGVGSRFEDVYRNHGVIMLRQPEQRLISMYNYAVARRSGVFFGPGGFLIQKYNMSIVDFANATSGCAVRMLTKEGLGWHVCMGIDRLFRFPAALAVSMADTLQARKRLRAYAFVGITEFWSESVCLLHAMFGGDCHPAEFTNVRKGPVRNKSSESGYDTKELQGFVDQHDGALYNEALSIFTENRRLYDSSEQTCQQCFQSGGLSAEAF